MYLLITSHCCKGYYRPKTSFIFLLLGSYWNYSCVLLYLSDSTSRTIIFIYLLITSHCCKGYMPEKSFISLLLGTGIKPVTSFIFLLLGTEIKPVTSFIFLLLGTGIILSLMLRNFCSTLFPCVPATRKRKSSFELPYSAKFLVSAQWSWMKLCLRPQLCIRNRFRSTRKLLLENISDSE